MSSVISRTKAQQLTMVYQVIALVCMLGAIAIGVFGLPQSEPVATIDQVAQNTPMINPETQNPTGGSSTEQIKPQVRIDPGSIAARFGMLDNAPEITLEVVDDTPPETVYEPSETTESGSLAKRVRYTGYISDNDNPLAFIRIDGTQRIVAEGGTARAGSAMLDDLQVKTVRPKFIVVSDGQVDDRIELADQNGAAISMSSGDPVVVADVPLREEDVVLTEEELEELSKMPARQRAMQERILRRKKMGRDMPSFNREPLASFKASAGNDRKREAGSESSANE
jgi:hypothetical protein